MQSVGFILSNGAGRFSQRTRGDLPGEAPAVLAPTALAFRSAVADDRVPVTVGLFLILRRYLKGKGLAVPEHRAAVDTETGNAHDGELHRQHITLLAARIIPRSLVNSGYFTIRKGDRIETRSLMRVFIEPEADRVLWLHVHVLLVSIRANAAFFASARISDSPVHLLICRGPTSQIDRDLSCPSESYRWQGSTSRSEAMTGQFANDPDAD